MPFLHNGRTIYGVRYDFASGSHLIAYINDDGRSDRCVKRADGRAIVYTRVGDVLSVNGRRSNHSSPEKEYRLWCLQCPPTSAVTSCAAGRA
jgi:hypothetical protein